jgi:hypothetical protein
MAEKKRLPPWEEAKLVFKMQEETRKRKLLERICRGVKDGLSA